MPQRHRYFALAPGVATIALGVNGPAADAATALGSAIGGLILAAPGSGSPAPVAALIAVAALAFTWTSAPERRT